jgi:hypothetical protein
VCGVDLTNSVEVELDFTRANDLRSSGCAAAARASAASAEGGCGRRLSFTCENLGKRERLLRSCVTSIGFFRLFFAGVAVDDDEDDADDSSMSDHSRKVSFSDACDTDSCEELRKNQFGSK